MAGLAGLRTAGTWLLVALGLAAAPANAQDSWRGNAAIAGGKAYVATPLGQLHYRDVGPRDAKITVLLLHQTWMSIIEFAEVQDALARAGIRSVAPDMPGHGMSDQPPSQPTLPQLADNLLPLIDALKLKTVVVAGHHSGAALATSFAARNPERVRAVILHGIPFYTREEIAKHEASPPIDRTPRADGSHFSSWYQRDFVGDPKPNTARNLESRTRMLLNRYAMGPDVARKAIFAHDLGPDLAAIRAPTLILTDTGDSIHACDLRAAKLRPDFAYEEFSDGGNMSLINDPQRWAKVAQAYIARTLR